MKKVGSVKFQVGEEPGDIPLRKAYKN